MLYLPNKNHFLFSIIHNHLLQPSFTKKFTAQQSIKYFSQQPVFKQKDIQTKLAYNFSTNNVAKQAFNQLLNHPYSRLCRW